MGERILVTGGAGFIGSNIVEALIQLPQVDKVIILDNLITGSLENIDLSNPKIEFIAGDIRNLYNCVYATKGINRICHQAAFTSVIDSFKDPLLVNDINIIGTLNIFEAAKIHNIKHIVYASSAAVYDNSKNIKKETDRVDPTSPYAISKYTNELYAKTFDIKSIGLRYFNVYGKKQNINSGYSAVIPTFINKLLNNENIVINGTGLQCRDFIHIEDVVQANIKALFSKECYSCWGEVYNVGTSNSTKIIDLLSLMEKYIDSKSIFQYKDKVSGDVDFSLSDNTKIRSMLDWTPQISIEEGIEKTINWYKNI